MGVGSQPHSPPELVRISPPRPTDPWTRANTAPPRCRLPVRGPRPGNTAHARRAPSAAGRRPTAPMPGAPSGMRAMARGAASADPRGSCHQPRRYHVSPAKLAPPAYPPWRNPARCDPESTQLPSVQNALALISSLYYTRAPQLPHASPPTRAPHIYVSSPSPRRLLASPQVEVLVS